MHQQTIPSQCDVLVVGGGPAGSSIATHLAQDGINVVVLERALFPRNQVGESLIPHIWKYTDMIGVSDKINQHGFLAKAGGITVWKDSFHQISFSDFGYSRPGMHVERDVFDKLLLDHAQSSGAEIYQEVVVKKIDFGNRLWPVINYIDKRGQSNYEGEIRCRYVVDASGHSTFLASQFKTRQPVDSTLNFLSLWGYFKDSRFVGADRKSHSMAELSKVKPVTFVMSFEQGWVWHIVLRQKTSVGLVVHTDRLKGLSKQEREAFFVDTCRQLPYLQQLLEPATLIEESIQFRPDYSYFSTRICGENYFSIGDAAAFVDPIFSHGVQNAFYNAAVTALTIKESLKRPEKKLRLSKLCENRMQQFYGFSRALSLGDFGTNGVNRELVKVLMKSLPALELELILVASEMTNRSDNFRQMAREAGVWESFEESYNRNQSNKGDRLEFS